MVLKTGLKYNARRREIVDPVLQAFVDRQAE
jgi:hypothetical protein